MSRCSELFYTFAAGLDRAVRDVKVLQLLEQFVLWACTDASIKSEEGGRVFVLNYRSAGLITAGLIASFVVTQSAANAQVSNPGDPSGVVEVTPLGSKTGEFCSSDRALIFQ